MRHFWIHAALVLGACKGTPSDCDALITLYVDADKDGFGSESVVLESCDPIKGYSEVAGDCDDGDGAVHPDAIERCDGVDQDCDGLADEQAEDAVAFYPDKDSDGVGAGDPTYACSAPAGHSERSDDCDDEDPAVSPEAPERCNEADDDCDGEVDEDPKDPPSWYADADGDGHGDPETRVDDCDAPDGFVDTDSDCDDTEPLAWTDAEERCGDGVDNDCDGDAGVCTPTGTFAADAAVAWIDGPSSRANLGAALHAGDVDGDGQADLILGAPGRDGSGLAASVLLGPLSGALQAGDAPWFTVDGAGDDAGSAVRLMDATDGPLLLITGPNEGDGGQVWLMDLPAEGGSASLVDAVAQISGETGTHLGTHAFELPGASPDGSPALVFADPDAGPEGVDSRGAIWVLFGPTSAWVGELGPDDAQVQILGENAWDDLGRGAAAAGDLDGDGLADLVLGAPYADPNGSASGRSYLLSGVLSAGTVLAADLPVYLDGDQGGVELGGTVGAAGDLNGDGYGDLMLAAAQADVGPDTQAGEVLLFHGTAAVFETAPAVVGRLQGFGDQDQAGSSLQGDVDLDQDGQTDVLIAAPLANYPDQNAGWAVVFYGPVSGTQSAGSAPAAFIDDAGAGARLGSAMLGGWDLDGAPGPDLVLGAPGSDGAGNESGQVRIFGAGGF